MELEEEMDEEEDDMDDMDMRDMEESPMDTQQFSRVVTRQAARGWGLRLLVMSTGQTRWLVKPPGTKRWLPDQRVIMQGPGAVDVSVAAALASEKAMLLAQVGVKRLAAPQPGVSGMDPSMARRRAMGAGGYSLRGTPLSADSRPSPQDAAARHCKKRRAMFGASAQGHGKRRFASKQDQGGVFDSQEREPPVLSRADTLDSSEHGAAEEALDIESSEYGSPYADTAEAYPDPIA